MKPSWRKRHAGQAFTSDAPLPFKKQRTGFVGGGSAEMAARTRHLMQYVNPQLSAALDAVAPVAATFTPAAAAAATSSAAAAPATSSAAAPTTTATTTTSPATAPTTTATTTSSTTAPTTTATTTTSSATASTTTATTSSTGTGAKAPPAAPPLPDNIGTKKSAASSPDTSPDAIDSQQKLWELASKMSGRSIEDLKKEKATKDFTKKFLELRQQRDDGVITKEQYSQQFAEARVKWEHETGKSAASGAKGDSGAEPDMLSQIMNKKLDAKSTVTKEEIDEVADLIKEVKADPSELIYGAKKHGLALQGKPAPPTYQARIAEMLAKLETKLEEAEGKKNTIKDYKRMIKDLKKLVK